MSNSDSIDSDTRVPIDCFLDAASEMHFSPECSIIQHVSDVVRTFSRWKSEDGGKRLRKTKAVSEIAPLLILLLLQQMIVEGNFFENGIAFFTRLVNTSISWVCANGDVGCFVGHNAFIRWSALQEIAQWKEDEKRWQIWSESHVSEGLSSLCGGLYCDEDALTDPFLPDQTSTALFACSLPDTTFAGLPTLMVASKRVYPCPLMTRSTVGRVSRAEGPNVCRRLTCILAAEYAFGVSELLLHRLKDWPFKGPLTPMAKRGYFLRKLTARHADRDCDLSFRLFLAV